jgi:GAF domain-containing protein
MKLAPIPENEAARLEAVHGLRLLDTPPEEQFDRITRLATRVFRAPISTITLVDEKREWFKSCQGLDAKEGDRAISFCGHAMLADDVFIIPDTLKDPRFADNPMVVGEPHIRFYAGVAVKDALGHRLGVLCIKDRVSRDLSEDDRAILRDLAAWVELEFRIIELQQTLLRHEHLRELIEEARDMTRLITRRELAMIQLKEEVAEAKAKLEECRRDRGQERS